MMRLKTAILREYEDDPDYHIQVHNPKTTQAVELYFRGEKMAKVRILQTFMQSKRVVKKAFKQFVLAL